MLIPTDPVLASEVQLDNPHNRDELRFGIPVDQSSVMTAMISSESRTVVKFMVNLGHSLGRCIAEGVEDAKTLDYLNRIGCDLAQGYYIARPLAGDDVWPWLASRPS